jgi:predicted O-methyltransferase YrrM
MSFPRLVHCLLFGKPYFGPALCARQGSIDRHGYFLPLLKAARQRRRGTPFRILEIGSWAGASAVSWAKGLETLQVDGTVLCIDSWAPYFDLQKDSDPFYAEMNGAAASGAIFELFRHNLKICGVESRVQYRRGESRQVAPSLASGSFDVVYLDGSHRYDDVSFDLREAARLVANNGVVCGDDLELQQHELTDEERPDDAVAALDFLLLRLKDRGYHPGVTRAVAEALGPVMAWNGFWAARKDANAWAPIELDLGRVEIPGHLIDDLAAERADAYPATAKEHAAYAEPAIALIGETAQYNIVRAYDRFLAVAKSIGPIELFHERIGERELGSLILIGTSAEEVRARAEERDAVTDGKRHEAGGTKTPFL